MLPLLTSLIFIPVFGGLATLATPQKLAKHFALLVSLVSLALAALALHQFNAAQPGFQFIEDKPWLPTLGISYHLGIDGISLALIALTALLTPLCILTSWNSVTKNQSGFMAALLLLQGAVVGVFSALDFILFYIFWEAMLIPMFLLIGIWGGENRVYAALKFFLYTFVGSVLMLVAGLYIYAHTHTFDITQIPAQTMMFPLLTQQLLFWAFFAAFAVKVPMFPFHTWLPDAHVQAPTAGSVILAGVLLKLGAYGFLRFSLPFFPEAAVTLAPYVFTLSGFAVVYAALVAYAQTDIKKLIAYSSVSHMGLVTLGLFAGTEAGLHGALLVMINHGIVSAGLFLAVGTIYERLHTRELKNFGGLVVPMPRYAFVVMVLTLAAVALPGTNSFVGEFLSLAGAWPVAPWATAAATSGVVFGALYMLWLYRKMIFGTPGPNVEKHIAELPDLNLREWIIFTPLVALVVILGIMPSLAMNLWAQPVKAISTNYAMTKEQLATPTSVTVSETTPISTTIVSGTTPVIATTVSETSPVSSTVEESAHAH